jgi:hypothetical protein
MPRRENKLQAVEKPASLGFSDNKLKKDAAAAAAPEETGGRNEFRHPLKYASGEKDESGVFDFFEKLINPYTAVSAILILSAQIWAG